ncbi:MAG: GNAT family N-acetyltransferase [Thermus sp.]|uniref:GNAT family N-acetyltransferase n=1 Tax=Thermus sp. TaxID=275 RepID=UPI0025FA5A56|nr:GNAT family N-acetyltransferase [Thermus sp.]MCS6868592.1 GNAT family N-acetyltransferase [Thermus sp.]MCS7218449.1 GNAT family N-acetyltransferase [Thermus sp.]MDW8016796.1 GNAT family N-acetyltransferase [Thermus sp.]MDW8356947.1 GNAT family N-acetyltransferase [Thermus sp.]
MDWPRHGRVTLKPFAAGLTEAEWRGLYETFRDPEVAEWNGSSPLRSPLWLFKRFVQAEMRRKDRMAFAILDEKGEYLGTLELYDLTPEEATLGILIGRKDRWGQGYGTEAVRAALGYAFGQLGLKRVRLRTFAHNLRARRAFQKAGFREVGFGPGPKGKEDVYMEVRREDFDLEA